MVDQGRKVTGDQRHEVVARVLPQLLGRQPREDRLRVNARDEQHDADDDLGQPQRRLVADDEQAERAPEARLLRVVGPSHPRILRLPAAGPPGGGLATAGWPPSTSLTLRTRECRSQAFASGSSAVGWWLVRALLQPQLG